MPCPTDEESQRYAAAEMIAAACGIELKPYQIEFLERISKRDIATPFAYLPTGGGKSVLMRVLAARMTPAAVAPKPAPVITCVLMDGCEHKPQRAPGFDWRQVQRNAHKKTPRRGQGRGVKPV